jgi:hypothetical protein
MTDDATLGGYERIHERPAAFEGSDGLAYSAEVFVDDAPDADGRYGAALLFVRWSPAGDRAELVLESSCLALADTSAAAAERVRALSLLEVKQQLDETIAAQSGGVSG